MAIQVNVRPVREGDSIFELEVGGIADRGQSANYIEGSHTIVASDQKPKFIPHVEMYGVQNVIFMVERTPYERIVLQGQDYRPGNTITTANIIFQITGENQDSL